MTDCRAATRPLCGLDAGQHGGEGRAPEHEPPWLRGHRQRPWPGGLEVRRYLGREAWRHGVTRQPRQGGAVGLRPLYDKIVRNFV